ncbi:MAG: 2-oxoacid:acceptor oxidoreductase family protein [Desulfarculales bacterium]|nr:2-oxoacid:acceptor oxidoreductase family protein [Desulfarculales bacterium]
MINIKNDISWQAIICGVGGQGVLYVNRILALAAQTMNLEVLVSEVHGMAQRGGSVLSHLRAGMFRSPLVPMGQADLLFALEKNEAIRNIPYLRPHARLVVNAPNLKFLSEAGREQLARQQIKIFTLDAAVKARQSGNPVNILLLAGAAQAGILPVSQPVLKKIVIKTANDGQRSGDMWEQALSLTS